MKPFSARGAGAATTSKAGPTRGSRFTRWLAPLLVLSLLGAAGCGGDDEEGSADSGSGSESGGTIKLGANVEQSGPGAYVGLSLFFGFQAAVDTINQNGGVEVGGETYELELVDCDNRTDPTRGVTCSREMAEEDVTWAVAPDLGFDAGYEIYKQNDVPIVAAAGGTPTLLLAEDPDAHPSLFFMALTFDLLMESYVSQLKILFPEVKSVGSLLADDEQGLAFDELLRAAAEKAGLEYVGAEFHPADATGDFSSFLTSLRAKDPDHIFMGYFPQVAVPAAEQAANLNATDVVGALSIPPSDFADTDLDGMPLMVQNGNRTNVSAEAIEDQASRDAYALIDQKAGDEAYSSPIATNGFLAVQVFAQGLRDAGSLETDALREAMLSVRYDGPLGPAEVLENHAYDNPTSTFVWDENGEVVETVWTSAFDPEPAETIPVDAGGGN